MLDRRKRVMVGLQRWCWPLRHVGVALCLLTPALAASATSCSTSIGPWGTLAADADDGQPVLPNIFDPSAKNAQNVCPGYKASNLKNNSLGITATLTLAGDACNVYGDDVDSLQLTVEYQSSDRLHVEIAPTYIGKNNESWFVPPASIMAAASADSNASSSMSMNDLELTWGNEPSFWIKVTRKSNSK
jgi:alpha-glucosidase